MKSKIRTILLSLICILGAGLASCSSDEPAPQPAPKAVPRTLLVYMVAANSLGIEAQLPGNPPVTLKPADDEDISQMMEAVRSGALNGGRLLVYRSRYNDGDALYELTADGIKQLKKYTDGNTSVSIARMDEVLSDVEEAAPADNYGLVLWSHANGWLEDGIDDPDADAILPASFGQDRNKRMNVTSLRTALEGHRLEYIYFDCCYMSTVEVAYELRHCASYIVGSASELPRDGMPYDKTVRHLMRGPAGLSDAAEATYSYYASHPDPKFRTCTIAVIDTRHMDRLAAATRAIYETTPLPHPGIYVTNYRGTARQGYSIDFGEYVTALAADNDVDVAEFDDALAKCVVYARATNRLWDDWKIYHHSGMATYVFNEPDGYELKGYTRLGWAKDVASHHIH